MSEGWTLTSLEDVPSYADEGRPRWHMIRSSLGIVSFGINAWTATEEKQQLIGEHDELGQGAGQHEEMYLVLSGAARFTLDGEEVSAPQGTIIYVSNPAVRRGATADPGTTILAIGGRPGAPFEISTWERSAEALRYWTTGEWTRAIAVLERQHAETPTDAGVLYNLACAEARGRQVDAALEHLELAISLEPRFAVTAQRDDDLASIRDDPRFPSAG